MNTRASATKLCSREIVNSPLSSNVRMRAAKSHETEYRLDVSASVDLSGVSSRRSPCARAGETEEAWGLRTRQKQWGRDGGGEGFTSESRGAGERRVARIEALPSRESGVDEDLRRARTIPPVSPITAGASASSAPRASRTIVEHKGRDSSDTAHVSRLLGSSLIEH